MRSAHRSSGLRHLLARGYGALRVCRRWCNVRTRGALTMAVEPKSARSRRRDNAPGSLVGPQGRPLREYRGWDAAREVFIMDGPDAEVLFSEPDSVREESSGIVTNDATERSSACIHPPCDARDSTTH